MYFQTCTVMAGFRRTEEYFVPRTHVRLPYTINYYIEKLLPKLPTWRNEASSRFGDKSTCSQNWLFDLLPWFIEVLVQDGIYFIHDFPNHCLSRYLRNNLPGYERWAAQQRSWVREQHATRHVENLRKLNQGAQTAFETLSRRN